MSAEATGWVYRHSPYKGAAFSVHLALADSANDQHGYRLWMRQQTIATKARTTRGTVNRALDKMVADGLLELLTEGQKYGDPNEYRLLLPDELDVVYETRGVRAVVTPGARTDDRGVCAENTPNRTQGVSQGDNIMSNYHAECFAAWWALYPKKVGKGAARRAYSNALKRVEGTDDPSEVLHSALVLALPELESRERQYVPHPATWLNQDRWLDEAPTPTGRRRAEGPTEEVTL